MNDNMTENDVTQSSPPQQLQTKQSKKNAIIKEILSYVKILVVTFICVFIFNHYIIANAFVPTGSMESTIETGSRIFINRLSYVNSNPQRGDIVSFLYPDDESENYLKRIIGLPGETIEGKDGEVYIDGVKLTENYIKDKIDEDFGPFTVPKDCYFMMGDNRTNSWDSRDWEHTFVSKDKIIGKAVLKYYPHIENLCEK